MSMLSLIPFLIVMGALAVLSACFSAAEAAFFSLRRQDTQRLATFGWTGRLASHLANRGEHLLTAILFCNLLVNVAYFTMSSVITLHWQRQGSIQQAGVFASLSILVLIFFSEMLPKSLAAQRPVASALILAFPIYMAVRLTNPLLPVLRGIAISIRRVFWPGFKPEPFLRVRELEKAVRFSQEAAAVLEDEQHVLENLVQLSDLRAEDVMQPRTEVRIFHRPVSPAEAKAAFSVSKYLFIVEQEDEAFTAAISSRTLMRAAQRTETADGRQPNVLPASDQSNTTESEGLDSVDLAVWAEPVAYVPWNVTAAQVLQTLVDEHRDVAAVVNEYGETVGIITLEDLLSRIFTRETSRSEQFFGRRPILPVQPGVWHVTGLTSVYRLCRYFGLEHPEEASRTVAGIFQDQLGRLPKPGDICRWGPFELRAIQVGRRGVILAELRRCDHAKETAE